MTLGRVFNYDPRAFLRLYTSGTLSTLFLYLFLNFQLSVDERWIRTRDRWHS